MKKGNFIIAGVFILLMSAGSIFGQSVQNREEPLLNIAKRSTLAIRYREDNDTKIAMVGTLLAPKLKGEAEVKSEHGRTHIKLRMNEFDHPQRLGSFYTTYVLWAIAPEGQAENLVSLPVKDDIRIDATTSFQTFGLIITAEPHAAVKLPSPVIVVENALRKGTKGEVESSRIEYRGDSGDLYVISTSERPIDADFKTPLLVLGARRSVEIAQRAGAQRFAQAELQEAEVKLGSLEQMWSRQDDKEKYTPMARDVMRLGEHARLMAIQRAEEAGLRAERRAASRTIAQARSEAEQARSDAERSEKEAMIERERLAQAKSEAERLERAAMIERERVAQAQSEAERAKIKEESARLEAERARQQAEQAKRERDEVQQRLYLSLSEILETRREARGLIVSLSDVLFDFNRATLKPGAREKLSKLAGILLAYPGDYRMEIEGHTDAIGSEEYNLRLSQLRAESVRDFLTQASIPASRITATRGLGKSQPIADNSKAAGRQVNRRVEIVIADITQPTMTNR
jgi:outer membrane protein OmpA-like peptidoglycan-associated protein